MLVGLAVLGGEQWRTTASIIGKTHKFFPRTFSRASGQESHLLGLFSRRQQPSLEQQPQSQRNSLSMMKRT